MKCFDYPQVPEELQKCLNDSYKLWEEGLKKKEISRFYAEKTVWNLMKQRHITMNKFLFAELTVQQY